MGKFKITIEEALRDIMPSFIELTDQDMVALSTAVKGSDWEQIKKIAHTLKGDSGGYGFDEMSVISRELEMRSETRNIESVNEQFSLLEEYWAEVKRVFSESEEA